MPKAHAALQLPLAEELAQRNLEHGTTHWLMVTETDLQDLSAGIVTERIRSMATFGLETVDEMLERKRKKP